MERPNLYWFTRKDGMKNFGDDLSAPVCENVLGVRVRKGDRRTADLYAIGSLLNYFSTSSRFYKTQISRFALNKKALVIWGTGCNRSREIILPKSKVIALRGKHTASLLNCNDDIPFGDPALLVSDLVKKEEMTEKIGVIPHYVDKEHPIIKEISQNDRYELIDVEAYWSETAKSISKCRAILSSSLHGLIAADSFEIPRVWIELSDGVVGNGLKFRDYTTAFDERPIESVRINSRDDFQYAVDKSLNNSAEIDIKKLNSLKYDLRKALKDHYINGF